MRNIILSESQNDNKYLYDLSQKQLYNIDDTSYEVLNLALNRQVDLNKINDSFLKKYNLKISNKELENLKTKFSNQQNINQPSELKTNISDDVIKYYLSNFPQIAFEVTENCNLECKYCTYGDFYDGNDTRTNNNLDNEAAKSLIKYIFDFCNSNYSSTSKNIITVSFYGGEPLLRFDFIKDLTLFANNLKSKKVSFQFSMTTNATLLKRHIEFLIENKFRLLISLDGNEDNHSYRIFKDGKNSFKSVYDNASFVKDNYPEYFQEYVSFNGVLHNKNSVVEINEFIKNNFGKNPIISEISTDGLKENRKTELLKLFKNKGEDLKQSEDYFRLLHEENLTGVPDFKEAMYFVYNLSNLVYFSYTELFLNQQKTLKPTGTCLPFARKIFVTAEGKILPCENVSHKFAFGTVTKNGVDIDLEKLKNTYNGYLSKMENLCSRCYRVSNCSQCMFYLNIEEENVKCYGFMGENEFSNYLSQIITYLENNPQVFSKIIHQTSLS